MKTAYRQRHITPEEYLAAELTAEVKHEYVNGEIFAMVGASKAHMAIVGNLYLLFRSSLALPCRPFMSDGKVHVEAANAFYYPDLFVTCDKGDTDPYVTHKPLIVVEVLSPSTEAIDRRPKLLDYKSIASVREIVLVAQEARKVDLYRRDGDSWIHETIHDEGLVEFPSIALSFDLAQIYADLP